MLFNSNLCLCFCIKEYDGDMRVDYKELMERLGVGHILSAYETRPWFMYDEESKTSCSAEVRIGPGTQDVEAEIQFLHEDPELSDKDPVEQILLMRILPMRDNLWTPKLLLIRGVDYVNKVHDWESRGCNFFKSCIAAIQMNELPDIEEILETELDDEDSESGRRRKGRIGKKSPSVNTKALMGMKR